MSTLTFENFKKIDILRNYVEDNLAFMIVVDSLELDNSLELRLELELKEKLKLELQKELQLELELKLELNETDILNKLARYLIKLSNDKWVRVDDSVFVNGETECEYSEIYLRKICKRFLKDQEKFETFYSVGSISIEEDELTIINFEIKEKQYKKLIWWITINHETYNVATTN